MATCAICGKRKAERFCSAKGEKICAQCCGTEREVSIDCPANCQYLLAAHRYEAEHRRPIPADTPFLEENLPRDLPHIHQQLLAAIAFTIAKFCAAQPSAADPDVLAALRTVAETYRTLISGIYYEKPPDIPVQRELYAAVSGFLNDMKQKASEAGSGGLKNPEIFDAAVFLFRMGLVRTNGRPRSRGFIEFLRAQFPKAEELRREESHLIVP